MKQLTQDLYNEMMNMKESQIFSSTYGNYDLEKLKYSYKLWKFISEGHFKDLNEENKTNLINKYDIKGFHAVMLTNYVEYSLGKFYDSQIENQIKGNFLESSKLATYVNPICIKIMNDKNWKSYGIDKKYLSQIFKTELSANPCFYDLNLQFKACKFIMENNDYFNYSANDFKDMIDNSNLIWNKNKLLLKENNYYEFFEDYCDSFKAIKKLFNTAKKNNITLTKKTWEELSSGYEQKNLIENIKVINPINVICDKLKFKVFEKLGKLSIQENIQKNKVKNSNRY